MRPLNRNCPDCDSMERRDFVKAVAATALVGSGALAFNPRFAHAAPSPESSAETAVGRLFESFSAEQKKVVCFPFEHKLRKRISANWHVTEPGIGDDFYNDSQRKIIREIVKNITSEDGYERFLKQMEDDDGGIDAYSMAIFGTPGSGKFEWELTGRHLTMRADGNSVDKAAFGGPIVYGHGDENAPDNLFFYQTQKANEVFKALDAPQAKKALLKKAPGETAVQIQGNDRKHPGIGIDQLSADQKELFEGTLKTLLAPYRQEDVDEVFDILKKTGGIDQLHMAFYQENDLDEDRVWDIWRIEGPSMVWHFRGAPHVHAYINIAMV